MDELSRTEPEDDAPESMRRALLQALASAPIIVTLASGPAHAHSDEFANTFSPCVPGDPQDPPPPPPGCGPPDDDNADDT